VVLYKKKKKCRRFVLFISEDYTPSESGKNPLCNVNIRYSHVILVVFIEINFLSPSEGAYS
jgi:hypothetical protein